MTKRLLKFVQRNWLAVILAFVPPLVIWYLVQKDTTSLEVKVLADVPVVTLHTPMSDRIEILYGGEPVEDLRFIDIMVRNNGTLPIRAAHFEDKMPIVFEFRGEVLGSPTILRQDPPEMLLKPLTVADSSVSVPPLLLNPRDEFVFRVATAGGQSGKPPLRVRARIANVRSVELTAPYTAESGNETWLFGILIGVVSSVSALALYSSIRRAGEYIGLLRHLDGVRQTKTSSATSEKQRTKIASEIGSDSIDLKAELLAVRIRIESLLRDMLARYLPKPPERRSALTMVHILRNDGILNPEVAARLSDLMQVINREVHEDKSYLTRQDRQELERVSIDLIGTLEEVRDNIVHIEKPHDYSLGSD